ncbi:hypothetical protein ACTHGU_06250 [Chitinophagaceae bacterium MMS25-I14]
MESILLVLDDRKMSTEVLDFACYMARVSGRTLVGVFLEADVVKERVYTEPGPIPPELYEDDAGPGSSMNEQLFCNACVCRETSHSIHRQRKLNIEDLIRESRFLDMIIVDPMLSLGSGAGVAPGTGLKSLLRKAECPVILAPQTFENVDELIFMYDGSKAAVHTIKQFTYLFPQFNAAQVAVIQAVVPGETPLKTESFREWLDAHYSRTSRVVLEGDPVTRLAQYLLPRNNALVVMGAYGRSFISGLFRPGLTLNIPGIIPNPVFMMHH